MATTSSSTVPSPSNNSRSHSGLNRVKLACVACRLSKKKCNGARPTCSLCSQNGIKCRYDQRQRNNGETSCTINPRTVVHPPLTVQTIPPQQISEQRYQEAGINFVQSFSSLLDPWNSTENVGMFAWNLGLRRGGQQAGFTGQIDLTSLYPALSTVFFETWHSIHSFLRVDQFAAIVNEKLQMDLLGELDVVLYGICGIASVFTGQNEEPFTEAARMILNNCLDLEDCPVERIVGWFLRTHYLQITKGPQAAWMASVTTTNLMDGAQLWKMKDTHPWIDLDLLFWGIRTQNVWISYEYGREMVSLRGFRPVPENLNKTDSLMHLFLIAEKLYTRAEIPMEELARMLVEIETFQSRIPRVMLSRTILGFAVFRRIRASHASASGTQTVMSIGCDGLTAVWTILEHPYPWPHLIYVPFQFLCTVLSIDSSISLAQVPNILSCLQAVVNAFSTESSRHVLNRAYLLIRAISLKKMEESTTLNGSLPGAFQLQMAINIETDLQIQQSKDDMALGSGESALQGLTFEDVSSFFNYF